MEETVHPADLVSGTRPRRRWVLIGTAAGMALVGVVLLVALSNRPNIPLGRWDSYNVFLMHLQLR